MPEHQRHRITREEAILYLIYGGDPEKQKRRYGSCIPNDVSFIKKIKSSSRCKNDTTDVNINIEDYLQYKSYSNWATGHGAYKLVIEECQPSVKSYIKAIHKLQDLVKEILLINQYLASVNYISFSSDVGKKKGAILNKINHISSVINLGEEIRQTYENDRNRFTRKREKDIFDKIFQLARINKPEKRKNDNRKPLYLIEVLISSNNSIKQSFERYDATYRFITGARYSCIEMGREYNSLLEKEKQINTCLNEINSICIEAINFLNELNNLDPPAKYDITAGVVLIPNHKDLILIKYRVHVDNIKRDNGQIKGLAQNQVLDPIFAYAMVKFILDIKADPVLQVIELYTMGFNRSPKHPGNTEHSNGRALDICGFKTANKNLGRDLDGVYHLRGGYKENKTKECLKTYECGPSDWFYSGEENAEVEEDVNKYMRLFAKKFELYFGQFIGPGKNSDHMNHFHVQLSEGSTATISKQIPATITDPRFHP